ncbi:unnamed protein product [Coccothraustes coccothraustes]
MHVRHTDNDDRMQMKGNRPGVRPASSPAARCSGFAANVSPDEVSQESVMMKPSNYLFCGPILVALRNGKGVAAIPSEYAEPPSPTGRRAVFAALPGLPDAFQDLAVKPGTLLFQGVIPVAFSNRQGVAACPVTTASASERGRSVRPEEPGVLRTMVVHLQSILAEHVHGRCCRHPRRAKERRRAGTFRAASGVKSRFEVPEATDFPGIYHLTIRSGSQEMCRSTFSSVSSKGLSERLS